MNVNDFKKDFAQVVDFFKTDISQLRTGRASTAMVEDISVEAYGSRQPPQHLAAISASSRTFRTEILACSNF